MVKEEKWEAVDATTVTELRAAMLERGTKRSGMLQKYLTVNEWYITKKKKNC